MMYAVQVHVAAWRVAVNFDSVLNLDGMQSRTVTTAEHVLTAIKAVATAIKNAYMAGTAREPARALLSTPAAANLWTARLATTEQNSTDPFDECQIQVI